MEEDVVGRLLQAGDGLAFLVRLGITAAHEHHRHGGTGVDGQRAARQVARGYAFQQVHQVALDAEHDDLRLRVAHAAVVLDNQRLALHVDEAEEDEALIVQALFPQSLYRGADDARLHFRHERLVGERDGRHGAHAAGVQPDVALADALVILRHGQYLIVLPIREDEDGALDAVEELLDDDRPAGVAEHTAQHLAQLPLRLLQRVEYQHALARRQAVGLQHVRSGQRFEEGEALGQVLRRDALVAGRRDGVPPHEGLGKILAAFQLGARFRGADHGDAGQRLVVLKVIVHAFHQRVFRTHHHHIHAVGHDEFLDGGEVVRLNRHVRAHQCRAGVAGSDKQFLHPWALGDLPSDRVLAPTRA